MAFQSDDRKGPVSGEGMIEYSFDDATTREIFSIPLEEGEMAFVEMENIAGDADAAVGCGALVKGTLQRENGSDIQFVNQSIQNAAFGGFSQSITADITAQAFLVKLTGVAATPITGKLHYKYTKN